MRGVHEFTVMFGASGASGYGFWVFLVGTLLGFAAVVAWAVIRLRSSGHLQGRAATAAPVAAADEGELPRAA
jgi:hypothetical protein